MIQNKVAVLKSKLAVYLTYYQKAEKQDDRKRADVLGHYIDRLMEEIDAQN